MQEIQKHESRVILVVGLKMIPRARPEYQCDNRDMPTSSSKAKAPAKPKRERTPHDFMTVARRTVEQAIGEKLDGSPLDDPHAGKNPAAVALGKLGGWQGPRGCAEPCQTESDRQEGRQGPLGTIGPILRRRRRSRRVHPLGIASGISIPWCPR